MATGQTGGEQCGMSFETSAVSAEAVSTKDHFQGRQRAADNCLN